MIKLVYCIRRRRDLSFAQFSQTWLEDHAPLVRTYAAAIRAVRYVQSHSQLPKLNAVLQASRAMAEDYDGITELWWTSLEAFQDGMERPEAIEAGRLLKRDEARFIDFERSTMFLTEEHHIFDQSDMT